jgi:hypothetical protein
MAAITSFATLQTALADWSNRTDLTSYLPDFIAQAEARLFDLLLLKDMESEESLTLTQGNNYVTLPSGYVSPIALWLIVDTERVALQHVLPQQLPYDTSESQPRYYAIDGVNLRFDCPAQEAYSAKFRMYKTSNLSVSNTSNYLLLRRPDIYLSGSMAELARFTRDQELFQMWESKFQKSTAELKAAENRSRSVGLRTDIPSVRRTASILRGD